MSALYVVVVHVHKNTAKEKKEHQGFLSILGTVYLRNPFTRVLKNGEDTFIHRCS